jgi:O-antigen/teichoic acid export membrane protein
MSSADRPATATTDRLPWRLASWGLASSVVASALTWVLQLAVARFMAPESYGEVLSLLAIFMVLSVPLVPVLVVVTRQVVEATRDGRTGDVRAILAGHTWRAAVAGAALAGLVLVWRAPLAALLRLSEPAALPWLALSVLANALYLVSHAVLLGRLKWPAATTLPVLLGASRLLFSLLFLAWDYGIAGVFLGLACSTALCWAFAYVLAWQSLPGGGTYRPLKLAEVAEALALTAAFWLLVQVDLVYVNRALPDMAALGYAAASTLARMLVYVPSTVVHLMFPLLVAAPDQHARRRVVIRMTMIVAALAAVGLAGLSLVPSFVLDLTYPPEYAAAARLLPRVGAVLAPLAFVNVVVYAALARRSSGVTRLLGAIALATLVLLMTLPPSLATLFGVLLGASAVSLGAGAALLRKPTPGAVSRGRPWI